MIDFNKAGPQRNMPPEEPDPSPDTAFRNGESHHHKPGNGTVPPGDDAKSQGSKQSSDQGAKANSNPGGPQRRLFKTSNVRQIKSRPDPVWMIDGLVSEQSLGFIYGAPSSLKTFTALDIALGLATGQGQWWGRDLRCHGAVIYICSEGTARFKDRISAWEQHNKVSADDVPFYLIEETINFMKEDDNSALLATVDDVVARINGPIAAVFVDTVSKVLPGARENLQEDMSLFVEACTAVRQRFRTVVFGLHHTNKEGGIRGSTVIPGAGDFIMVARRDPGSMSGLMFVEKVRDGEDGWELHFKATKIELGGGSASLVVEAVGAPPKNAGGSGWPSRAVCKEILTELHAAWIKGAPWSSAPNSARSARLMIEARWKTKKGVAAQMLASWMANGIIEHTDRDKKNHVSGYRKLIDL
ncbi:AAA family ATPase [Bradyrhizobium sp. 604_D8_N2_3]|uniref:AAA family ATPase n=1 Tax=Bradyrhizobium sp. 604_D8_N2_3 TaxID=3240370 RepID=UPI003F2358F9